MVFEGIPERLGAGVGLQRQIFVRESTVVRFSRRAVSGTAIVQ